jgi:intracellular septation protein A
MPDGNKKQGKLKTTSVLLVSLLISIIAFNAVFVVGAVTLFFLEHTSNIITTIVLIVFAAVALVFATLTFKKIKRYFEKEIRET